MKYYYKDKPYQLVHLTHMKVNGEWVPAVIYKCLYVNPDGMLWVREREEFYNLFKPQE